MTTTTKQTILYSRLSREDERANESLSIENQKAVLEEYATRNGFTNLVHLSEIFFEDLIQCPHKAYTITALKSLKIKPFHEFLRSGFIIRFFTSVGNFALFAD